ncbi:replication restart helicase PriA [Aurantibacillus circumpalustris]|uniref:replication restart helicase PriA n=1 Tax=Aurantibacillus circumpalustris TaxID=3036359 RepID=UPI00295B7799|nr:primosomal protein N' [Aurantibacillus circumpalustris]
MQGPTYFVDVIVPLSVPNKYTYRVPNELNKEIEKGKRVLVQFGKTKIYTGIIYQIHEKAPKEYEAKYIEAVLDEAPIVTEIQLTFWVWISFYYCANPGDVMNAALPSGLKLSSTSHIQLNPDFNFEEIEHRFFTDREHIVIDALHVTPNLSFENLSEILEVKSVQPIIHKLLKKNAIVVYEDVKDKYKPKLQTFIKLSPEYNEESKLQETLNTLEKKAFKQAEALIYFLHLQQIKSEATNEWIKKSELLKKIDNVAINALVKKTIFIEDSFEVGRLLFEKSLAVNKKLSTQQESTYNATVKAFEKNKTVLLHGVTGSGKTEIYIQLIKDTLAKNKSVLFLIPEIALTTQLITRLRAVFGEIVGVYHSRFSENERVEIWNNVLSQKSKVESLESTVDGVDENKGNQYKIILGARSCLFLPYNNLGLIIIDEEHDNSFKQYDPAPRYHARDAALYLSTLHQANVLLGSATPSIESFFNTQQGKYELVKLENQFVSGGGTAIEVCDVNHYTGSNQMKASLTPPLFDAIENALAKKQQVILFQNRRGFAPYTECKQCGHVPHCIQCDVSLIYHKHSQKLICHYCGYSVTPPKTCSACGSNQLHYKGMGTEKIEEDIEILFPNAKIARMDLDSTRSKYAYKQLIDDFEGGNIDILIGTQMVTKGLDFENVSVVGVLNADSLLNFPDFRSFEKAFQMLTQVKGRAGRNNEIGKVFIQTTQIEHHVIKYITENRIDAFFSETLAERQQYNYPPFSRLFEVTLISKDVNEINHLAMELFVLLKPTFGDQILGPEFPLISKIKNQYHKHVLIKASKQQSATSVRETIYAALNNLQNNYKNWRYRVSIDVDPV